MYSEDTISDTINKKANHNASQINLIFAQSLLSTFFYQLKLNLYFNDAEQSSEKLDPVPKRSDFKPQSHLQQ